LNIEDMLPFVGKYTFNLPHLLFMNLIKTLKKLGNEIISVPYIILVNHLLWYQRCIKSSLRLRRMLEMS